MSNPTRVGLKSAIAIVIGNMVGVSIYIALGYQVLSGHSGIGILALWTIGAVIALLGALSYAELAAAFPKSGGEYHFLNQAYPPMVGFLSGWIALVAGFPAPVAMGALALGQYMIGSFESATPLITDPRIKAIAIGTIVIVTAVHSLTLRSASRFQGANTAFKILLLLVLGIGGFVVAPAADALPWMPREITWDMETVAPFFISLYWVFYAYTGWNSACYISSEVDNPQRNVPRALMIGIGVVFSLYLLLMAGFIRATPEAALAGSGSNSALVAASHIFGEQGGKVIGFLISIGLISFISSMTWAGPRISQRMGQDYAFLGRLAKTNAHGIPRNAIFIQSALAIAFILLFDSPEPLLYYVEFLLQISVFLTVLSVIILRVRQPDLVRPIRTWGYPFTPLLFLIWTAFAMGVFLKRQSTEAVQGLATLAAGMLVYVICKTDPKQK